MGSYRRVGRPSDANPIKVTDITRPGGFRLRTREHFRRLGKVGQSETLSVSGREEPGTTLPLDPVIEEYKKGVDRTLLRENLRLTVQERVDNLIALQHLAAEARQSEDAPP